MNQNRLLENRRLGLVFDLDNTLMEQTDDLENTIATSFGIPDIYQIQFERRGKLTSHLIILRPGIKQVLEELAKLYDLSIYTNGIREYAEAVIRIIDPSRVIFGSRIIARDDVPENGKSVFFSNFAPASKDISYVLPGLERMGVVVDDSVEVWKDREIVIRVPQFRFWKTFSQCYQRLTAEKITEEKVRRETMFRAISPIINNGCMSIVRDTLLQIHTRFYHHNHAQQARQLTTSVGEIMCTMRSSLFRNCVIYLDGSLHVIVLSPTR